MRKFFAVVHKSVTKIKSNKLKRLADTQAVDRTT